MAKSLIRNKLGDKVKSITVPTNDLNAIAFATDFLDGEWEVLQHTGTEGSDVETVANEVNVMVKSLAGTKTYFSFLAKNTMNEDEIFTAIKGLTINGVLVEQAYILGMKQVNFS
ncbi:MAG: hypothetical protein RQ763_06070 [Sulfurimonas sp.]|uniref:hypothetical protein n=1 Tax=Sulfurimonas sp. TaxID=2022749 RepID=UPI0028CBD24B|nr:hypothetical protein [Sulfurimonas sp.]MDT8338744.1 hypothetical protein [Sulfurimonas sp.]